MESLVRLWSAIASRFRGNPRDGQLSAAPGPPIEPLDFPEDTKPALEVQFKLDWFSTDLYAFALDKFRQG